jgi:ubiquinol-cytochrome c reductase cytochrome b subunit
VFKRFFWILVVDVVILTWAGGAEVTPTVVAISQIATAYYFAHFLIILPIISRTEETLPLPSSISTSALHGELQESAPLGTNKTANAAAE